MLLDTILQSVYRDLPLADLMFRGWSVRGRPVLSFPVASLSTLRIETDDMTTPRWITIITGRGIELLATPAAYRPRFVQRDIRPEYSGALMTLHGSLFCGRSAGY